MTASIKPTYEEEFEFGDIAKQIMKEEGEKLMKQVLTGGLMAGAPVKNPYFTSTTGPLAGAISAVSTHDGGKTWDRHDPSEYDHVKTRMVVDIGVDANGACITLDDISTIEIRLIDKQATFKEITNLNLLNGTYLSDIVVTQHRSFISNSIGRLEIRGVNGAVVAFDVMSDSSWVANIEVIVKEANAIRKQAPSI